MKIEFKAPQRQGVWGWPAAANFTLGGAGAASYLLAMANGLRGGEKFPGLSVVLVALGMIGAGLGSLGFEAGAPGRGLRAFTQWRRSWMSRELWMVGFFACSAVGGLWAPALRWPATAGALGLIFSHGFILQRARAVSAWNLPWMPCLLLTQALVGGAAVGLALPGVFGPSAALYGWALILMGCEAAACWWDLRQSGRRNKGISGSGQFKSITSLAALRLGPALVLGLSWALSSGGLGMMTRLLTIAGAGALLLGSFEQKETMIRRTAYLRGLTLRVPV